jgi:protein SCO1/2
MRTALNVALILSVLAVLAVAGLTYLKPRSPEEASGLFPVAEAFPVGDFSLTERSGKTVTPADLSGKVWIASFVFTRCTGPCPQVTGTVARLQTELASEPDIRLVTFTVDPDRDDENELKTYADKYSADPERWLFLTGKRDELYRLIEKGFKLAVAPNEKPTPGAEVSHSTRLAVVDRHGRIRGYFDGRQVDDEGKKVDEVPKVVRAVKTLLAERE